MKRKNAIPYRFRWGRWTAGMLLFIAVGFWFSNPGVQLRIAAADSIMITQHRHWAKYLIGEEQFEQRLTAYRLHIEKLSAYTGPLPAPEDPGPPNAGKGGIIKTERVKGMGWNGYLMTVPDPRQVRLMITANETAGEKVTEMVRRTGAAGGINGGGFVDPTWTGNGYLPIGLVIANGKIRYGAGHPAKKQHIIGFTEKGRLVAGSYSPQELLKAGVRDAVQFSPVLIADGRGLLKGPEEGWGIAPRTAIGQRKDGTVLMLVAEGRQTGSIGATLYDLQQFMLEKGAVTAANLDGGASSVMAGAGGVLISEPAGRDGERSLPTAFLVYENADKYSIRNQWKQ